MSQTLINTLRFSDRLKEAGFAGAQAEALARVLGDELTEQLPSKADFMALKADFMALKADFKTLEGKFDALEAKVDGLRLTLNIVLVLLGLLVVLELVELVSKLLGP